MEKFLRSNNFARILAVFMAIILWLFVTGDEITRATPARELWQEVPLRVENLHKDYVVTEKPASVDVTVEGLPENLEDLVIQELDVFVDLSGKEPGNHLIQVQGRAPRGVSLQAFEPEQVRIVIEEFMSDSFTVEIDFVGEPADGWKLVDYRVNPEEVMVGAPASKFELINKLLVIIDLTGMKYVERVEPQPVAYDEEETPVTGLLIDPESVIIRLEFERVEEPVIEEPVEDENNDITDEVEE